MRIRLCQHLGVATPALLLMARTTSPVGAAQSAQFEFGASGTDFAPAGSGCDFDYPA